MKTFRLIPLLFISLLLITSCNKKEDDTPTVSNPNKGTLTIGAETSDLGHGEAYKFDKKVTGLYIAHTKLLSSTFVTGTQTISGTGHGMDLTIYTSGEDKITPATYKINNDLNSLETFTMDLYTNWELSTDSITAHYHVTSGKMKVTMSGGVYTLDINVLADKYNVTKAGVKPSGTPAETDVVITAKFKGNLNQKYFF